MTLMSVQAKAMLYSLPMTLLSMCQLKQPPSLKSNSNLASVSVYLEMNDLVINLKKNRTETSRRISTLPLSHRF